MYQTWGIVLILSACGAPPSTKSAQGNKQVASDCAEDDESEAALLLDETDESGESSDSEDSESESDDTCEPVTAKSKPVTKNGSGSNAATAQNPPVTAPQPAVVTPAPASTGAGSAGGNPFGGLLGGLGGGGLGGLGGGGGLGGLGSLLGGLGGGGGGLGGLLGGLGGGGGGLGGLLGGLGGLGGGGGLGGLLGGLGGLGGGGGSSPQQPAPAPAPAASGGTVTYSANIAPYLQRACVGCHSYLGNYSGARGAANSSLSRMKSGNMPTSGRASDSEISQFQAWVSAGTPQ